MQVEHHSLSAPSLICHPFFDGWLFLSEGSNYYYRFLCNKCRFSIEQTVITGKKTFLKILIIISPVILFVLAYFGAKFFDAHDSHSTCITLTLFGFYCPACGMTRSVIALMNGDILLSIRQNAMVLVFALLYAVFYIWYVLRLFNVKFYLFLQNSLFIF